MCYYTLINQSEKTGIAVRRFMQEFWKGRQGPKPDKLPPAFYMEAVFEMSLDCNCTFTGKAKLRPLIQAAGVRKGKVPGTLKALWLNHAGQAQRRLKSSFDELTGPARQS